jgi:hypothetical protein
MRQTPLSFSHRGAENLAVALDNRRAVGGGAALAVRAFRTG